MDSRGSSDGMSDVKGVITSPLTQTILGIAGLVIGLIQPGQGS
jgi:hypothetical protein